MSNSEKIYRFLIGAYSRTYRSRYAAPMEQFFRDRLREVHGFPAWIALWGRTLADWALTVPASYRGATPPNTPFGTFGDPARRCIFFARCEASSFGHSEVTAADLLLGILRQQPELVAKAAVASIVRAIEAEEPLGRRPIVLEPHARPFQAFPAVVPAELGAEAMQIVAAATEIAHTADRPWVAPRDLAAAILQTPTGLAARLLREYMSARD